MTTSTLKKHVFFLIVTTSVCASAVIGVWYILRMLHTKKDSVLAANQEVLSYTQNKKIFADESKSLAAIGARLSALEGYRITEATLPQLLSSFEALAQKNNVDFSITTVNTPGTAPNQKLLIDFSANGGAADIDTFLDALSHQSYEIAFTKFSLYADPDQPIDLPLTEHANVRPAQPQWQVLASIQVLSY